MSEEKVVEKKPVKGSCPVCFNQYYYKMKSPKVGKAALLGDRGLTKEDFETNYREFSVLLINTQIMGVSVCLECYTKLTDENVRSAFMNTLEIDVEDIKGSRLDEKTKEKSIELTNAFDFVFWSKEQKEVLEKRKELFPNI